MTQHRCLAGIDGAWGCVASCPVSLSPTYAPDEDGPNLLDLINDNWNGVK